MNLILAKIFQVSNLEILLHKNFNLNFKFFKVKRWQSAQDLRNSFLDWITENLKISISPKHWPNFKPLTVHNYAELMSAINLNEPQPDNRDILIVVEKTNSFFGREVNIF